MTKLTCYRHPTIPMLASCAMCSRPICSLCALYSAGQPYCPDDSPSYGAARQLVEQVRVEQFSGPVAPPQNSSLERFYRRPPEALTPAERTKLIMRRAWWGIVCPLLAVGVPILPFLASRSARGGYFEGLTWLLWGFALAFVWTPTLLLIGMVNSLRSLDQASRTSFAQRVCLLAVIGLVIAGLIIGPTIGYLAFFTGSSAGPWFALLFAVFTVVVVATNRPRRQQQ